MHMVYGAVQMNKILLRVVKEIVVYNGKHQA